MENEPVDILLATYNGQRFLSDQLESILNQSYKPIRILISDDGSTDGTFQIIQEYCQKHPDKIKLIKTEIRQGSAKKFMSLVEYSDSPFIFFSDQDDIWEKDKIDKSLAALKKNENQEGICAVYSDMTVVDESLKLISDSFLRIHNLNPEWRRNKYAILAQSMAAGCTIAFNSRLKQKLHSFNSTLFQHDHWILMHAAWYGKVLYIPQATVKYRQHSGNEIGAHGVSYSYFLKKLKSISLIWSRWIWLSKNFRPAPSILKIAKMKFLLNFKRF